VRSGVFDYWIRIRIHSESWLRFTQVANRMTLGVSNVSRIHFGFEFIVNPDPDPIID